MKRLSVFWQQDITNKLIVIIGFALFVGFLALLVVLIRMPEDKSVKGAFYEYFPAANPTFRAQNVLTNEAATLQAIPTQTFTPKPATITSLPTLTPEPAETITPITGFATLTSTSTSTPTPTLVPPSATPLPTGTKPASAATALITPTTVAVTIACLPAEPTQTGSVVDIMDGNTIRVLMDDGLVYTVRYAGIVPPENIHYAKMATSENSKLVYGKKIVLTRGEEDKDPRGRLLRYVTVGQIFVNQELLRLGLATVSESEAGIPCMAEFQAAEQQARTAGVGLWSLPQPTSTP